MVANPNHSDLKKYYWIKDVESIYQFDNERLNISEKDLYQNGLGVIFQEDSSLIIDLQRALIKINGIICYVFNHMSDIANIKFNHQNVGEQITILVKPSLSSGQHNGDKDSYFSIEKFDYSLGKTNHVQLSGNLELSDSDEPLTKVDFSSSLHGVGHIIFDHPNDANIAI